MSHEAIAECVNDVLTTFWRPLWSITEQTQGNMESIWWPPVLYNKETNYYSFFSFQNLSSLLESWPLPTLANTKKSIWRNLFSIQNEAISLVAMRSKELWLVQENHCQKWLGRLYEKWKITAKAELNYEIHKSKRKCWKNQGSYCHQNSSVSRKAWILLELKDRIRLKNLRLRSTLAVIWFESVLM